jgi:outer membrane protein OmpA-like peptidoglycan-associated protein
VVSVYNKDNVLVTKTKTDNKGNFKLLETPNAPFYIAVDGFGYYNSSVQIDEDLTQGQSMHKTLELIKVEAEIIKNAVVVNNKTYDAINVENILFDFDESTIKAESYATLHKVYNLMKAKRDIKIVINAHTDAKGAANYNNKLSEGRALAVYNHLINEGISKDRLTYESYGENQPIKNCDTCSDEENAQNRRVEFVLK